MKHSYISDNKPFLNMILLEMIEIQINSQLWNLLLNWFYRWTEFIKIQAKQK